MVIWILAQHQCPSINFGKADRRPTPAPLWPPHTYKPTTVYLNQTNSSKIKKTFFNCRYNFKKSCPPSFSPESIFSKCVLDTNLVYQRWCDFLVVSLFYDFILIEHQSCWARPPVQTVRPESTLHLSFSLPVPLQQTVFK